MRARASKAFTLVEILIVVVILGILAAIVIPQFTNASQEAQTGNVQSQLQTIRSQIELFRVRNNGESPDLETSPFIDLLRGENATTAALQVANSHGRTQQTYLRSAPVNPRNQSSAVLANATPIASANVDPTTVAAGWYYNVATGEIAAVGFNEATGEWWEPAP